MCRWYHGLITRAQAEDWLKGGENGLFLVRESTNYRGDYTLCVVADGRVEHYHVLHSDPSTAPSNPATGATSTNGPGPGKLTIDEEDYFDNLTEMVKVMMRTACCSNDDDGDGYGVGQGDGCQIVLHKCSMMEDL